MGVGDAYNYPMSDWASQERFTPGDDDWTHEAVCSEPNCDLNHLSGPNAATRLAWNNFTKPS